MSVIKIRAAMPGNPAFYTNGLQDYGIESLEKLKNKGINTIFINLAWSRPHIDIVCLEHIAISKTYPLLSDKDNVIKNRQKIRERVENAKKLELKTMALFGIPQYFDYSKLPESYKCLMGATKSTIADASVTCIESPDVMILYKELISDFIENVPEIDGMLIYSYDELAEVCDEKSDCPRCHGKSQEDRVSKFLNNIYEYCLTLKENFEIWWEPWEFSWSQVYGALQKLNTNITVSCHSTICEVYFTNHPDLWFRSIAALCKEQGRNMVGELFMSGSGEDLGYTAMYPCPRLVFEQINYTSQIDGVTGLKEYFGICTKYMSVNERIMVECFAGNVDYNLMIENAAQEYTSDNISKGFLLKYWEKSSRALEILPWEISWVMRFSNYHPYDENYWGKVSFANLMKTPWNTPSWLSNRRSYYMVTNNSDNLNNEYCQDIIKRFDICLELINDGIKFAQQVLVNEKFEEEIKFKIESSCLISSLIKCRRNHLLLSLEMEKLRNGEVVLPAISDVLSDERENAFYLLNLVKNSPIPYMLNIETIEKGIKVIDEFIDNVKMGAEAVLLKYKYL